MFKRILLFAGLAILLAAGGASLWLYQNGRPQQEGEISLAILDNPVRVVRDSHGIPYIFADTIDDAFRAQGFIAAQDRLLQLTFLHRLVNGRLAETIGERGLGQDRLFHMLDIRGIAKRKTAMLTPESRRFLQTFADGLNAYIATREDEFPLGLKVLGVTPEPWQVEDQVAMLTFMNWSSSVNWRTELLSQQIVDAIGTDKAAQIAQLSINPDDEKGIKTLASVGEPLGLDVGPYWFDPDRIKFRRGSNNWAVSGDRTASGKPILASDPHLGLSNLPGTWHPVGIVTPEFRAVGAGAGWVPGVFMGRTSHIAMGVTNAYGDMVDLTIETVDPDNPDHYMDGDVSRPFITRVVGIRVKDKEAEGGFRTENVTIRDTVRGPVISDHGMTAPDGRLISLNWSGGAFLEPALGIDTVLFATTVDEARRGAQAVDASVTFAFVDSSGNIGHQSTGAVPLREDGSVMHPAGGASDWKGRIPAAEMPGVTNPVRGWVGSSNHRMISPDYPYYYSAYSGHSYRYRRLAEVLDGAENTTPADQWALQRDAKNMMAERLLPLYLDALDGEAASADLVAALEGWDYVDRMDSIAPTVFQAVNRHVARLTYELALDPKLAARVLSISYYWQDRLDQLLHDPDAAWFDNADMEPQEHRDSVIREAAAAALAELTADFGPDPKAWRWGDVHHVSFNSPVLPMPWATDVLGGGTHAMGGSGETLYRAGASYNKPYNVGYGASLRLIVDMADPDKIMAVVPGGVSGRQFSPHMKDQVASWLDGTVEYWWFSDQAINEHATQTLNLLPK